MVARRAARDRAADAARRPQWSVAGDHPQEPKAMLESILATVGGTGSYHPLQLGCPTAV